MARRRDFINGTPGKKQVCRLYWPDNNGLGMSILFLTESRKVLEAKTYRRDGTETAAGLLYKDSNASLDDVLKTWETLSLLPDPDRWTNPNGFVHITGDLMSAPIIISGVGISDIENVALSGNGLLPTESPRWFGPGGYNPPGLYTSGDVVFSVTGDNSRSVTSNTTYTYNSNGTSNYRIEFEEYEEDDMEDLDK